jgi:hypothetical protein
MTAVPDRTSTTARYLCSTTFSSRSMSGSVTHQMKPPCRTSSGARQPVANFSVITFSTVSRARCTRRAPGRRRPADSATRRGHRPDAAQLADLTRPGPEHGTPAACGAPPTALGPGGPQRRRRTHRTQRGRRHQDHAGLRRCPPRKLARKPHPPGAQSRTAQDHPQGRTARVARDGARRHP